MTRTVHKILSFELRYQRRRPVFWIASGAFFLLGLGLGSTSLMSAFGSGVGLRNAPLAIASSMPVLSLLGLFVIAAFVSSSALRDLELGSDGLLFTKPISESDFLWGRFAGALLPSLLVLSAGVLGVFLAAFAPWQDAEYLGPVRPSSYLFAWAVMVLPNLWIMGALLFVLAALTRRSTLTFLGVVVFIGAQDLLEVLADGVLGRFWGALLEPSGVVALEAVSRYWTTADRASRLPELIGPLGLNRLIWSAVALGLVAWVFGRVSWTAPARRSKSKPAAPQESTVQPIVDGPREMHRTREPVELRFGLGDGLRRLFKLTRLELRCIFVGAAFWTSTAFALILLVAVSLNIGSHDGLPAHPTTSLMVDAIGAVSRFILPVLVILFAGELVNGAQARVLAQVGDTLPTSNALLLAAKTLALGLMVTCFLAASVAVTVFVQLGRGHEDLDPGLYLQGLVVLLWPLLHLVVLALGMQVLAGDKWLGFGLAVAVAASTVALPRLGFEHPLYLWGQSPPMTYSDMNGYGHLVAPFLLTMVYWTAFSALLWLAGLGLWNRGPKQPLQARLRGARGTIRPGLPVLVAVLVPVLVAIVAGGLFVYKSSGTERGASWTRAEHMDRLAAYETRYQSYEAAALPRILAMESEIELYPAERRAELRGRYRLVNPGSEPIHRVPVTRSPRWVEGVLRVQGGVTFERLEMPGARLTVQDDDLGFYVLELDAPLPPGQETELFFAARMDHGTFAHRRHNYVLVDNGTFFSNRNLFPVLGYARGQELQHPAERRKRGLDALRRAPSLDTVADDPATLRRNYLGADWIHIDTVVSTAVDQIALAPGRLVERRNEDGRSVFHYQTEAPMADLYGILSGRYAVRQETVSLPGEDGRADEDIEVELYVHPEHAVNVDRFLATARRSLEVLSRTLGPYPHSELRIVEVPNYHDKTAFAFGGTIAFSESWGFLADYAAVEKGNALDWPTAILAHEIAHQWWNHQVLPADVQGATAIAEGLCQHTAALILEQLYGPDAVADFMAFHLDRYLRGRGRELLQEMPLERVENQDYVHYHKGALVFWRLHRALGADGMHEALRSLIEDFRFQGPPYVTTRDLMARLKDAAGTDHHGLIDELLGDVALVDFGARGATVHARPDGGFEVRLDVPARKWSEVGDSPRPLPLDEPVELAVLDADGRVLHRETRRLTAERSQHVLILPQQADGSRQAPDRVVVDPDVLFLDTNRADNTAALSLSSNSQK